jgi:predicted DCC family thiol-disulfide oxidoreductase YuxK
LLILGFVNWVADNDAERNIKFAAQQQHMDMLERLGAPTDLSTLILVEGDEFYLYSSAALRTMALMDHPWDKLSAAYAIPEVVRDFVYKIVARNRYWVFGKSEKCRAPSADFRSRFLGYDALADEENEFAQDVLKKAGVGGHSNSKEGEKEEEATSRREL